MHQIFSSLALWTLHIILAAPQPIRAQQASPVWVYQTFNFGWAPYNATLTRCGLIDLTWGTRTNAVSNPVGPYYLNAYRAGQAPYRIDVGTGKEYPWTVNLNAGGPYMLSMEDSHDATGGVSISFTVQDDGSCASSGETSQTLSYNVLTQSRSQCDTISMLATGGTPPYKLTVVPQEYPPKRIEYASGRFDYVLDVPSGVNVMFAVEDSAGRGAVSSMFTVASSSNSTCLALASTVAPGAVQTTYPGATGSADAVVSSGSPAPTSSSTTEGSSKSNTPIIAGAVIGGLALVGLFFLVLFMCRRRRRQAKTRQNQQSDVDLVSEPYPPQGHTTSPPMSSFVGASQAQPPNSWYHTPPAEGRMAEKRSNYTSTNGGQPQQYQSFPNDRQALPYVQVSQQDMYPPHHMENDNLSSYQGSSVAPGAANEFGNRNSWLSAPGTSSGASSAPSQGSSAPFITRSSKADTERYSKYTDTTDTSVSVGAPAHSSKYDGSYIPPVTKNSAALPSSAKAPYQLPPGAGPTDPYGAPATLRAHELPPPQYSE